MPDSNTKKIEEKILRFWNDRKIFERSVEARAGNKRYIWYDGPPTANGKPGIHHFIGRAFKDLFPRYKTMRGYHVPRKAGWDTHGLPVEIAVEKELGFTNKQQIEKYGIAKFNAKAKKSVWKYKDDWQKFVKRMGHWLDLNNPYITYDANYMESLWWVIKQFDKKKLLYEGHKVLPWCPRCGTALSSHELAQGYKEVTDRSVYIKFRMTNDEFRNTYLLAWTTTPWTLPGNVALAVGNDIDYVQTKEGYILAKDRVEEVLGKAEIVKEFKGGELAGLKYEPLFDIRPLQSKTSYQVYVADFVTTTDGTGIVHTAVMYGEDDYELGKKLGLPMRHTVAPNGTFTKDVKEFEGRNVKEAGPDILKYLETKGYQLKAISYSHSYPHCWRCKTPLIYYAKHSWFVAMSKLRGKLLKNNSKVNWVPEHLRDGRFGEFLREVKDWAFSRERYWGTPLPIWKCSKCENKNLIGSLGELEEQRFRKPNTYILVRHGHSDHNAKNIIEIDLKNDVSHLTETGRKEIGESAKKIQDMGGADIIVSSPFVRARETADIISKALKLPVSTDSRLIEFQIGKGWNGRKISDWFEASVNRGINDKFIGGESWHESKLRMMSALQDLEKKYEGKRIIIVSHGESIWALKTFFNSISDKEAIATRQSTSPKNGEVYEISLPNYPRNKDGEVDLHRPFVDDITLKCEKCEGEMRRVPEVADVWFDSGAMPFAQWYSENGLGSGYPVDWGMFKKNFPADFITEGIDQTRGWFYTLLAVSTALGYKAPYKNVISYGHVLDDKGKKMSKSIGNVIDPWEVIEQHGADAGRWYFYAVNNPGDPKLFAMADVGKVQRGFLGTLLNCLRFYELNSSNGQRSASVKAEPNSPLDYWILSKLNNLIKYVTASLDSYDYTTSARQIESFVINDLSNWWIRRSRERIAESSEFLRCIIIEVSKLVAPFIPFTAEHIYKSMCNKCESVHLEDWPKAKDKYINEELEKQMSQIRDVVALGLALRKSSNIKVRQPLASIAVKTALPEDLHYLVKEELNVKEIVFAPSQKDEVTLDTKITHELKIEGYARELARAIQDMRKEAKYRLNDKVRVSWTSADTDISKAIEIFGAKIAKDTLLKSLEKVATLEGSFDVKSDIAMGSGKIMIGVRK